MLQAHNAECAAALAARSQAESDFLERLVTAAASYQRQLEDLRVEEGEETHQLKVK